MIRGHADPSPVSVGAGGQSRVMCWPIPRRCAAARTSAAARGVLHRDTDGLVEGDLVPRRPAGSGSRDELADLRVDVVGRDDTVADGHQQVVAAGGEVGQGGGAGFHADERVGDRRVVDLPAGGVEADGCDVRARRQPRAPDDRFDGVRGRADDVRAVDRRAVGRGSPYVGVRGPPEFARQGCRLGRVAARDADLAELPYLAHRVGVGSRLGLTHRWNVETPPPSARNVVLEGDVQPKAPRDICLKRMWAMVQRRSGLDRTGDRGMEARRRLADLLLGVVLVGVLAGALAVLFAGGGPVAEVTQVLALVTGARRRAGGRRARHPRRPASSWSGGGS